MVSGSHKERPRHLTGADRADGSSVAAGAQVAGRATPALGGEIELADGPPVVRVHRRRLALAVAITLASLPILVLDNLPATASADREQVATGASEGSEAPPSTAGTTVEPETTSTTVASTETLAPSTTEVPSATIEPIEPIESPAIAAPAPAPTTTVAPPPAPTTTSPPVTTAGDPDDPATWEQLARCEAGGNWSLNSGNGYYGGLQFSVDTWRNVGGVGYPHQASKAEQISRGKILLSRGGWAQWPHCARQLGFL